MTWLIRERPLKALQRSHRYAIARSVSRGERVEDPTDAPYALAWSAYLQRLAAPRLWRRIAALDAVAVVGWAVQLVAASAGNHRAHGGWVENAAVVAAFVVAPVCGFLFLRTLARRAAQADTQNHALLRELEHGWRTPNGRAP